MNTSSYEDPLVAADRTGNAGARRANLILLALFVFSLPLVNPWVRGDGVGYYAFARALLIERRLDFTQDYVHANQRFREARLDEKNQPRPHFLTATGRLENHFSVGPAILWSPFLLAAHAGVLLARSLGSSVAADGFSAPYRIAMGFATALYGFLALLLSFRLACRYAEWKWAFLATVGVWGASSLPVYMYFNPSWSHAHSAFTVAIFLCYWHKTRGGQSFSRWLLLGGLAGLMLNVYYANAMVLVAPGVEALLAYAKRLRGPTRDWGGAARLVAVHTAFLMVIFVCLLPTFITRQIIYGAPLESGYIPLKNWLWSAPALLPVLFSSNHGLFSWTPILLPASAGLLLLAFYRPNVGGPLLAAAIAFYSFIACYPTWDGISSYGNRFFVSLTLLFVLGLAVFLQRLTSAFGRKQAAIPISALLVGLFVIWNIGFMFQWGMHLVPVRGPISWNEMVHNQFLAVPRQVGGRIRGYLFHRSALMKSIERKDLEQLRDSPESKP
jgi:hypothetical protein